MTTRTKKDENQGYQALYEELELRYGAAAAQEIMDQIKKADDQDNKPDYMDVKAVSEVLEAFKTDIEQTIEELKQTRAKRLPAKVSSLEEKRLEQELEKYWQCYRISHHGFFQLYDRALKTWEVPDNYRYDRNTRPTKMKVIA